MLIITLEKLKYNIYISKIIIWWKGFYRKKYVLIINLINVILII